MTELHKRILDDLNSAPATLAIDPPGRSAAPVTRGQLSAAINSLNAGPLAGRRCVGILSNQRAETYIGVMAAFFGGLTFVPMNAKLPVNRLEKIVEFSKIDLVLHDDSTSELALQFDRPVLDLGQVIAETVGDFEPLECTTLPEPDGIAYHMFTSGSTGAPKGVPVSFGNLSAYISGLDTFLEFPPAARFSQLFDLGFDLAMHDIFAALSNGGTIVPPSQIDLLMPASYIAKKQIDVWFSVPFQAQAAVASLRDPSAQSHHLKLALFCGEQLPTEYAAAFKELMAPSAKLYNLYGPTEATIAFTQHDFDLGPSTSHVVPIGRPFGDNKVALLNDDGQVAAAEEGLEGELLLGGAQVFDGYQPVVEDPFVNDGQRRFYRSGDRVQMVDGVLHHLHRIDDQIKIRGYRVEIAEIEAAFRETFNFRQVAAVLVGAGATAQIALAYVGENGREVEDPAALAAVLPDYMVPSKVLRIDRLPLNANDKIDRRALKGMLE